MTCTKCQIECKRFGKHRNGLQRFRCRQCGKTFTEEHEHPFRVEDYLMKKNGILALKLLLEGSSVRTVERVTGIRHASILSLLVLMGERCESLMSTLIRNVKVSDVQADEIWSFIGKKESHKKPEEAHDDSIGDCYVWTALEARSKLVLAYVVGRRTNNNAMELMRKLRAATCESRFQLTTDGLAAYLPAVDEMISDRVDFAQLVKIYRSPREGEHRYSPAEIAEAVPVVISGNPNKYRICTSHVERHNLSIRMGIRRFTRLTNAFSKKLENHSAAVALYFAYYNFCRLHQTLRITPAMEAGVTDHVWSLPELIAASARVRLPAVA
jgi:transposase-like protein/IS1 family transposase